MRALVFFLVFANLAAFVMSGGATTRGSASVDERAHAQLSPDRIRILSKSEPPRAAAPAVEPICLAWVDLPGEAAERLQTAVAADHAFGLVHGQMSVGKKRYWVHLPAAGGKAGAEKRALELKDLGVKDYLVMAEPGADQWVISLGLFSSQEAADKALAKLERKGVRNAKLLVREHAGQKPVWRVQGPPGKVESLRALIEAPAPLACGELGAPAGASVAMVTGTSAPGANAGTPATAPNTPVAVPAALPAGKQP